MLVPCPTLLMVLPLLPSVPVDMSEMIPVICLPPPASPPPISSFPSPPAKGDPLPGAPPPSHPGCELCSGHAGMEKQPIRDLGSCLENVPFSLFYKHKRFHRVNLQMADRWDHISQILKREEKEIQEAMRAHVGITSSCTNNLSKMEFLKVFIGTGIIAQCKKRSQNFRLCLFLHIINFCTD